MCKKIDHSQYRNGTLATTGFAIRGKEFFGEKTLLKTPPQSSFLSLSEMKHFVIAALALIPVAFYIAALATDRWSISAGLAAAFANLPYNINYGIFRSSQWVGAGALYQTESFTGCGEATGSLCDQVKTAEAFTIMALVLVFGALVLSAANKGMLAAALFAVSGSFGMIGWVVWFAGVHSDDFLKTIIQQVFGSTDSGFTIGYSQALDIAAWTLSIVLAPVAFFTARGTVGPA